MKIRETGFNGLYVVEPDVFEDARGYFFESWNQKKFAELGLSSDFVQDNQSMSGANVLRGLHFQLPPWQQGKLVRVLQGSVTDVVVDLRKKEHTFGKYFKIKLTAAQKNMLWVPAGFAHGFLTHEPNTVFFYKCTNFYNKDVDAALKWDDPDLAIDWGIQNPIVSAKDEKAPAFRQFKSPF